MTDHLTKTLAEALRKLDSYVSSNLSTDYPTGIDLDAAEFRKAREALAKFDASQQAAGEQALPPLLAGWAFEPEGDTMKVASPVNGPGVLIVAKESRGHAQRMLYALCAELARAAQAAQPLQLERRNE